ncbi:MAG: glutaredoxin domain-containing protein [Myxococcota bacterium]
MTAFPAEVVIYTTAYCGFCHAAKRLLGSKGVDYREVPADRRPDLRSWLVEASAQSTVPQIFINGTSIGGFSELAELETGGELDPLLEQVPPVDKVDLPA